MTPDSFTSNFVLPESLRPEIQAFGSSILTTLSHAGVTLLLLFLGAFFYAVLTPNKEIRQIREGNSAAAVSYGGVIVGLAVPLAASMAASTSIWDILLWGVATVLMLLLVFRLIDMFLAGLPQRVNEGEVSAAVLLVAAKLSVALILAAAVSG